MPPVQKRGGFCVAVQQPNKARHDNPHKVLATLGAVYKGNIFTGIYNMFFVILVYTEH